MFRYFVYTNVITFSNKLRLYLSKVKPKKLHLVLGFLVNMKLHILFLLVTHLQCWQLASAPEFYDNKNISEIHSKNVVGSLIYTPLVVRLVQEFRTRRKRFCRSHRRFGHRPNRRRHPHRRHHRRRKCRRRPQPVAPMQPAVTPEPPQPSTTEAPEPAKPVDEHQPEATSESNTPAEPEEHKEPEDEKGAEELGQGSDAHAEAHEADSDRSQEPVDEGDDVEHTTSRLQSMECWFAVERWNCAPAVIYDSKNLCHL